MPVVIPSQKSTAEIDGAAPAVAVADDQDVTYIRSADPTKTESKYDLSVALFVSSTKDATNRTGLWKANYLGFGRPEKMKAQS